MKFSIIMPTHNVAEFIEHSIQSVLNQNYNDYELVIIDDQSTDQAVEKIKSFTDEKIR